MRSYDERAKNILEKRDEAEKANEIKRRKAARLGVIAAVLVLAIVGATIFAVIASKAKSDNVVPGNGIPADTVPAGTSSNVPADTKAETKEGYNDGVIGENTGAAAGEVIDGLSYSGRDGVIKGGAAPTEASPSAEHYYDSAAEADYEGEYIDEIIDYPDSNGIDAKAGTLTAGEWKDADNIADWQKLLSGTDFSSYVGSRKLDTTNVITVKVVDGENACCNVTVKLLSGEEVIYTAKTDINGNAYLFGNITGNEKTADAVAVGEEKIALDGKTELTVNASDAGIKVTALDLMLMIDTTGSMGDELEYIKAELYDVVARVAEAGQNISIRVSVNFYRDEGDDYVVKYYDFREDVNECIEQLKEQYANGGGDYPEAVHTALDNAVSGHNWREEAVKLCFIVLDAPPHSESEIQGINAELLKTVKAAAEQGIRIIPVASSGVDAETEFLMRSYAIMTGGTYVFITDDSGIGGGHKEADVGEHTVEYLNECMIRIACQYCGIFTGEIIPYTPPYHQ